MEQISSAAIDVPYRGHIWATHGPYMAAVALHLSHVWGTYGPYEIAGRTFLHFDNLNSCKYVLLPQKKTLCRIHGPEQVVSFRMLVYAYFTLMFMILDLM